MLVEDVPTRWNSTYDMFEAMLEKREALNKIKWLSQLDLTKMNYLISSEEWDLLKMFAYKHLSFYKITKALSKSKTSTASTVLKVYQLLIDRLDLSINTLNNISYDARGLTMNIELVTTLKSTYKAMKEKLLKYEWHLKNNVIFSLGIVFDPQMKFIDIPTVEQDFIHQNLYQLFEVIPYWSSLSKGRQHVTVSSIECASYTDVKCSKVMHTYMKHQWTNIMRVG